MTKKAQHQRSQKSDESDELDAATMKRIAIEAAGSLLIDALKHVHGEDKPGSRRRPRKPRKRVPQWRETLNSWVFGFMYSGIGPLLFLYLVLEFIIRPVARSMFGYEFPQR